jgi:hypothetical protein
MVTLIVIIVAVAVLLFVSLVWEERARQQNN